MPNFATATIAGHLGSEPELKSVGAKNTPLCSFSVAVNTGFGDREVTTWYRISIFGNKAEPAAANLKKGSAVILSGVLQNRPYEKDGETRYSLEINANEWSFAGGKGDSQPQQSAAPKVSLDDDLPF